MRWYDDDDGVLLTAELDKGEATIPDTFTFVEKAGPREKIYFDPKETTAAIVTCGVYVCVYMLFPVRACGGRCVCT